MTRVMKGTVNVISGGFISGGETSDAREVYASQISETAITVKHPRKEIEVVISFSELETEYVT